MNVALRQGWTIERFLDWAGAQDGRYEFDGFEPVGMTGGSANHSRITVNLVAALKARLRGTSCSGFGPDLGVQAGSSVRYPDALITCSRFPGTERLAPDVCVVFEVLSKSTARTDRITKAWDYARVPTLRRYVLVESDFAGLTVLHRTGTAESWTATMLETDGTLDLPEAGIVVPVAALYEDVEFPPPG